ncbi:MAG: YkgJ family cysteine cluster protein [Planctomycetes bacterium]|nr:YkgJ family cysteine cluster protein [Planctomycetota bacterium]
MSGAELDCQACGACCAGWLPGEPFVAVTPADAARLGAHAGLVVPDDRTGTGRALATRTAGDVTCCAALEGDPRPPAGRVRCAIYAARPDACRRVEPGDDWCRTMRARLGFEA